MKIVKLNRRHKLYHSGFTHAFMGSYGGDSQVYRICDYFTRVYGNNRLDKRGTWFAGFTSSRITVRTDYGTEYTTNPYWIAVRSEADITAAVLATG